MGGRRLHKSGSGQEQVAGCCEQGNEAADRRRTIFWLAEKLLVSQEGVGYTEALRDMDGVGYTAACRNI